MYGNESVWDTETLEVV